MGWASEAEDAYMRYLERDELLEADRRPYSVSPSAKPGDRLP